jgi:malate permease and related proteins
MQGDNHMDLFYVINNVVILVILIIIGYVSVTAGILDTTTTLRLSRFLLNVTLPALIIVSMQIPLTGALISGAEELLLASAFYYAIAFLIAWIAPALLRSRPSERGVLRFTIIFANVGFMGFPIIESLLGSEALFYAAIFNLPFNVLIFTVGVVLITGDQRGFDPRLLISPGIFASLLGLAFFIGSVRIPTPFIDVIDILGSMTTPLAMVIVGAILAGFPVREMIENTRVFLVSGIRLLVIPFILWAVLRLLLPHSLAISVALVLAAMPAAANSVLFSSEYSADPKLASQIVFVSTLASVATIPLIVTVLCEC